MDRLTGKHYDRGDYYMVCSGSCANDDEMCGGCPWLEKIINRLGAYEDTGLEPEDMKKAFRITAAREKELAKLPGSVKTFVAECLQGGWLKMLEGGVSCVGYEMV